MERKVFTDYCLPQGKLTVYLRIPAPNTFLLDNARQLKAYVTEWYLIDDEEREHRMSYLSRYNDKSRLRLKQ